MFITTCGWPAPARPFTRNPFHYNWHWQWDYSNGEIGTQGIHEIDVARWGLGVTYPVRVSAMGSHVMFDDEQETPNYMTASFEFNCGTKTKSLVFEQRPWMVNGEAGVGVARGWPPTPSATFSTAAPATWRSTGWKPTTRRDSGESVGPARRGRRRTGRWTICGTGSSAGGAGRRRTAAIISAISSRRCGPATGPG